MKKSALLLMLFFTCNTTYAEVPAILKCHVQNAEWTSLFTLDAAGAGLLKFKKSGDKNAYSCELKAKHIYNGQRAVVSNITVKFERGYCDPELGEMEQEIFDHFTLIVDQPNQDSPTGRVQWLKKKQPDTCIVEKLNLSDVAMQAKKWGRKTASEPKKKR